MIRMMSSPYTLPRIIRALGVAIVLALLTGCGVVKIAYNNAQSLTYWWLDGYLDFTDDQSVSARKGLEALHLWHRKTELPGYIATLKKMQQFSAAEISPAQVCDLTADVRSAVLRVGEQSERTLGSLVPILQADQLQSISKQFDKNNKKWREQWIEGTPKERFEKRLKKAVERAEMLYGRLDEKQLEILRLSISQSSFDARLSYREVLRRQQDLLQTFREHSKSGTERPAHVRAELLALLQRSVSSPDLVYRAYAEKMVLDSCDTLSALHNSTTPSQRAKALKTLQDYENDLKALAAQPG